MIYLFIERIKVIDSGGGGTLHLSILIGLIQLVDSDWSVPIGCRKLCDLEAVVVFVTLTSEATTYYH